MKIIPFILIFLLVPFISMTQADDIEWKEELMLEKTAPQKRKTSNPMKMDAVGLFT